MIDKDLLEILACPETHQGLSMASKDVLKRVNDAIGGGLKNKGGQAVEQPLDAGLVREDGKVVYPIRDEIPVLLIDEGIAVP